MTMHDLIAEKEELKRILRALPHEIMSPAENGLLDAVNILARAYLRKIDQEIAEAPYQAV